MRSHESTSWKYKLNSLSQWLAAARLLGIILLMIYLPALAIISIAVIMTSKGPAFISRKYLRPNGSEVDLWEFRTDCWQQWQPTPLGRVLRDSNMYRLPALVNIIRGDIEIGERVKSAN